MPLLLAIVLTTLLLENDDLFAATVFNDFSRYGGALQRWNSDVRLVVVAPEEDFIKRHLRAGITDEGRNSIRFAWLNTILLAASTDDSV